MNTGTLKNHPKQVLAASYNSSLDVLGGGSCFGHDHCQLLASSQLRNNLRSSSLQLSPRLFENCLCYLFFLIVGV